MSRPSRQDVVSTTDQLSAPDLNTLLRPSRRIKTILVFGVGNRREGSPSEYVCGTQTRGVSRSRVGHQGVD